MSQTSFRRIFASSMLMMSMCTCIALNPLGAAAQTFEGGDIQEGLDEAEEIRIGGTSDLRVTVIGLIQSVLSYMALIATVVIIIAGLFLIVGGGSDDSRDRARKVLIYTLIGFVVIVLARAYITILVDIASGGS